MINAHWSMVYIFFVDHVPGSGCFAEGDGRDIDVRRLFGRVAYEPLIGVQREGRDGRKGIYRIYHKSKKSLENSARSSGGSVR